MRVRRAYLMSIFAVAVLAACASGESPPFATVPGPESPELLIGITGRFAIDEGQSPCYPLRTVDPSASSSVRRCVSRPERLDGDSAIVPTSDGVIVRMSIMRPELASDARSPLNIALQTVADCRDSGPHCRSVVETIATWTEPMDGERYHQPLAVSPDGRWAAVVPSSHLLKGPGYSPRLPSDARFHGLRYVGALKLVDLRTHDVRDAGIEVVADQPISWSADGKRLLLVRAESLDALPQDLAKGIVGPIGHPGQGVPVVQTWDVDSGALTMLAIGLQPLWSPDDRTLLYQPSHDRVATLDLVDRVEHEVQLPGMSTRYETIAIAFVAPRKVLYWALPTIGVDPDYTTRNSPLVGPKQMLSLKVTDLDTGRFATVYQRLDPRARIGYRAN